MPEVPDQMQENLANLESEGGAGHRQSTYTSGQYGSAQYGQGGQYAQQAAPPAQPIQAYQQSSSSQPLPGQSSESWNGPPIHSDESWDQFHTKCWLTRSSAISSTPWWELKLFADGSPFERHPPLLTISEADEPPTKCTAER